MNLLQKSNTKPRGNLLKIYSSYSITKKRKYAIAQRRRSKMSEKIMGGVEFEGAQNEQAQGNGLPAKQGLWSKFKGFWLQEINVELTPYQQKVEDEINEFLHQEITWGKVKDFLFQEVTFGKKKGND